MADQNLVRFAAPQIARLVCTHQRPLPRYFSPYPIGLDENKVDAASRASAMVSQRGQGLGLDLPGETSGSRFSRPHSRMTDLLSGASTSPPDTKNEDDVTLWVCDKCFKYMTTGASWELHTVNIYHVRRNSIHLKHSIEKLRRASSTRPQSLSTRCAYNLGSGWCSSKGGHSYGKPTYLSISDGCISALLPKFVPLWEIFYRREDFVL
jgi:hypothetical protein